MRFEERYGFCLECQQNGKIRLNHLRFWNHLFLTFLTVGWWIPMWILFAIANRLNGWHCAQCGSKNIDHKRRTLTRVRDDVADSFRSAS